MTIPREVRGKFYALRALAIAFGVVALVAFLLWPGSFWIRSLGLLAIGVGVWLVRRSNGYVWRAQGQMVGQWSPAKAVRRVGPLAWTLTVASLVTCGVFYFLTYMDALHGGKEGWPAYAFGGAVLALAVTSGYVTLKVFR